MQTMYMIMIYYWYKRIGSHSEHVQEKMYPLNMRHQINVVVFYWHYINFQDMLYFFEFLVSGINQ